METVGKEKILFAPCISLLPFYDLILPSCSLVIDDMFVTSSSWWRVYLTTEEPGAEFTSNNLSNGRH